MDTKLYWQGLARLGLTLDSVATVCRGHALHWVLAQQLSSMPLSLTEKILNCCSRICIPCTMQGLLAVKAASVAQPPRDGLDILSQFSRL